MRDNIPRNPRFCYFASFLIISLTPFGNEPNSSSDLTIFIKSFISLFEIIRVVMPHPKIFLWIAASVADHAAVNSNGIKALLTTLGCLISTPPPLFIFFQNILDSPAFPSTPRLLGFLLCQSNSEAISRKKYFLSKKVTLGSQINGEVLIMGWIGTLGKIKRAMW